MEQKKIKKSDEEKELAKFLDQLNEANMTQDPVLIQKLKK